MIRVLYLGCMVLVAGCANVKVTQVDDTGRRRDGAVEGFYVPRLMPYLLVADLPPDPAQPVSNGAAAQPKPPPSGPTGHSGHRTAHAAMASSPKPKKSTTGKGGGDSSSPGDASPSSPSASASASDLSFLAVTKSYVMKLIYLPDYSHQQAISTSSGLFGKATLNLQLADGTLTSLQANMDSTENGEVFKSALTAATTAASGGIAGAPAAVKDAATKAEENKADASDQPLTAQYKDSRSTSIPSGVSPPPPPPAAPTDSYLHPGLYKLDFDETGKFMGLHKVTGFCPLTGLTNNPNDCTLTK